MAGDIERGELDHSDSSIEDESHSLLPASEKPFSQPQSISNSSSFRLNFLYTSTAFILGVFCTLAIQYFYPICVGSSTGISSSAQISELAAPHAGSTTSHNYPPPTPSNAHPSLFPIDVGYAGPTPTGGEAGLVATAPFYPSHTDAPYLVKPATIPGGSASGSSFNLFRSWGNLSPWYSVPRGAFGLENATPGVPNGCRVTGLHLLHRHGARYPTNFSSYGGPSLFASRIRAANLERAWTASGQLEFLSNWTYKLGEEVLTPFGRQQLYDLGVAMRLKYGFLLHNFTESNTIPVFRTESQHRMLASAQNFALGFFGWPLDGKYQQSVTIEAQGYNNTLSPYMTCKNAKDRLKADRGTAYVRRWAGIYLADARKRLQTDLKGYELSIEDVYTMQQMCAYETVAIGYSTFCTLFTEEEWEGFHYATDIYFWYGSAFGSPVGRVQGVGYVKELLARLTHTPIAIHNSSTNATLDDDHRTFPLGQSLYVDATHEVVVLNVITALNLSNFAQDGPLSTEKIPKNRHFKTSQLAPFATNIQFQLLACDALEPQIRIIINDGVTPLTSIRGCPTNDDGMCPLDTFIAAEKELADNTDWDWACNGDWEVPPGPEWETVTGDPPAKP